MSASNPLSITGPNHSGNVQQPNTAAPTQPANQPQISVHPHNVPNSAGLCGGTSGPTWQGNKL